MIMIKTWGYQAPDASCRGILGAVTSYRLQVTGYRGFNPKLKIKGTLISLNLQPGTRKPVTASWNRDDYLSTMFL